MEEVFVDLSSVKLQIRKAPTSILHVGETQRISNYSEIRYNMNTAGIRGGGE